MKLSRECKIHKAAAKDRGRYVVDQVKLEIDADGKSRLVATDGRVLAVVPVIETQDDTAGFVPPDAIAEAIKGSAFEEVAISVNGAVRFPVKRGTLEVERVPEGNGNEFPRWRQVVPKGDVVHRIALNPQLLMAVAEAIGSPYSVVLEYRQEAAPLVVRPACPIGGSVGSVSLEDFDSRFGLVMPISASVAVPDGAQLTAGQKAAATRKRNGEARAAVLAREAEDTATAAAAAAAASEPVVEQPAAESKSTPLQLRDRWIQGRMLALRTEKPELSEHDALTIATVQYMEPEIEAASKEPQ